MQSVVDSSSSSTHNFQPSLQSLSPRRSKHPSRRVTWSDQLEDIVYIPAEGLGISVKEFKLQQTRQKRHSELEEMKQHFVAPASVMLWNGMEMPYEKPRSNSIYDRSTPTFVFKTCITKEQLGNSASFVDANITKITTNTTAIKESSSSLNSYSNDNNRKSSSSSNSNKEEESAVHSSLYPPVPKKKRLSQDFAESTTEEIRRRLEDTDLSSNGRKIQQQTRSVVDSSAQIQRIRGNSTSWQRQSPSVTLKREVCLEAGGNSSPSLSPASSTTSSSSESDTDSSTPTYANVKSSGTISSSSSSPSSSQMQQSDPSLMRSRMNSRIPLNLRTYSSSDLFSSFRFIF